MSEHLFARRRSGARIPVSEENSGVTEENSGVKENSGVRASFRGENSGVSRLCRLAAPGMMKMELGFGSLWLEAGVG